MAVPAAVLQIPLAPDCAQTRHTRHHHSACKPFSINRLRTLSVTNRGHLFQTKDFRSFRPCSSAPPRYPPSSPYGPQSRTNPTHPSPSLRLQALPYQSPAHTFRHQQGWGVTSTAFVISSEARNLSCVWTTTSFFSDSCALFHRSQNAISRLFNALRALSQKYGGGGPSPFQRSDLPTFRRSDGTYSPPGRHHQYGHFPEGLTC